MSVGAALTEARERAGLTVTQVADLTMIRRTLIENIEADDYHSCGGDFYARMHIKSIAHAVGIEDVAPLLAEFDSEHAPPDVPTASGVLDLSATSDAGLRADRRRPNWTVAMAVALAAVVGFGGFQLLTGGGDSGSPTGGTVAGSQITSESSAATDSPSQESEPSASTSDEPSTAPSDAIAAVPAGEGVTVELNAVDGKSWVSATGKDSGVLFQNVLNTGRTKTFTDDRQVKLVVGNAGAVHLVVNGRDLGTPGGTGEVVRLTFGPGDPTLAGG